MDHPTELTLDQLAVAELLEDVPRDVKAVSYLLGRSGREMSLPVEQVLEHLHFAGLAEPVNATGDFGLTPSGAAVVRWHQKWEFEVLETFRLTVVEHPLLRGRVITGVIRPSDQFTSNSSPAVGWIEGVEFINQRGTAPEESVVLRVDRDGFESGDILKRVELLAG